MSTWNPCNKWVLRSAAYVGVIVEIAGDLAVKPTKAVDFGGVILPHVNELRSTQNRNKENAMLRKVRQHVKVRVLLKKGR